MSARRRRSERYLDGQEITDLIQRNTFGGNKTGIKQREMPVASTEKGIKMEWENREDKYPANIWIRMTDGEWVEYIIRAKQPGFQGGEDDSGNPHIVRGYPRRAKGEKIHGFG